jgi:hypothetical protein
MALAFAHRGVLVIVLDKENLERLVNNDPFVFDGSKVPIPLTLSVPLQVMVCYATKEEQQTINSMATNPEKLVQYLTRGWNVGPGDSDDRYREI